MSSTSLSTYFLKPLKNIKSSTTSRSGAGVNRNLSRVSSCAVRVNSASSLGLRPSEGLVLKESIRPKTRTTTTTRIFSRLQSTTQTRAGPGANGRRIKLSQALSSSSYLLGLFAPPEMFTLFHPRPIPPPPPENSEEANRITARVEKELNELEILRKCREAPDASEWYEARPYVSLPPERLVNHFTAGVIRGPTKIAVPPIVRSRKDETETWVFFHLGTGICGHEGIVHGGLLATLLDEGCARPAFLSFPSRVAVTANLNINFRAPTKADQFVIMKTKLVEFKGRKAVVDGRIEDLDGRVLVDARGIYVEPKLAAKLYHTGIPAVYPSLRRNLEQMAGANPDAGQTGNVNDAKVGVETEVKVKR